MVERLDGSNYNNIGALTARNPLAFGQPALNYNADYAALMPLMRTVENSRAASFGQELQKTNMANIVRKATDETAANH